MKKLENILRVVDGHLVMKCCKIKEPDPLPGRVQEQTLHRGLYVAYQDAEEIGYISVTCPVCKSEYHITGLFIWNEIQKYEGR
ncbi:hypothetical protein HZB01_00045 [Candidatus Woesearchaeota archaeon]|nr:hypothetical protein [Candidatus Woesearchaeota archaeon]